MKRARWVFAVVVLCGCVDPTLPPGTDGGTTRPRWERYIRGDVDTRLVIELDYVPGAEPRAAAEADLIARLSTLLDKPDGIEIVHDDVLESRGADHAWTFEELDALARESFDDESPPGTVTMHVMWLDGHDADDSAMGSTLGLAWGSTHIVMYQSTIEDSCDGLVLREQVCASAQRSIWLHEVGHVIGLVDNGLAMTSDHRDPAHGAHDIDEGCIMYWAFEGRAGVDVVRERITGGGAMIDFDDACLADIAAVRDR